MDNGASSYRRYLDGDKDAFDEILREYWDPLVFFLCRMEDPATAEDIAMDVFAELIASKGKFNFKVSLKTYLFMLGRSRALNHIKRSRILPTVPLEEAAQIPAASLPPEEQLLRKERVQTMERALAQLSPELKEAVYLAYYEGLTCEEVAKVMKKNRKQVYNLLYRGKVALRTILESEDVYEF